MPCALKKPASQRLLPPQTWALMARASTRLFDGQKLWADKLTAL